MLLAESRLKLVDCIVEVVERSLAVGFLFQDSSEADKLFSTCRGAFCGIKTGSETREPV
jgi:hypothetical protein